MAMRPIVYGEKGPIMQLSTGYASYLLRLRQVRNGEQLTWVAFMQSTVTGEQRSFPSVMALIEFLQDAYGECGDRVSRPGDTADPRRGEETRAG